MWKYDPTLEKYLLTHSGYFRLATAVVLSKGITDENILFCHGISEQNIDKEIVVRERKIKGQCMAASEITF